MKKSQATGKQEEQRQRKMSKKEDPSGLQKKLSEDKKWCYDMLAKTSRSFAAVIRALSPELRDAVCVFYLTLRALDSVEDDPNYPPEKKIPELQIFYTHLTPQSWSLSNCGEKEHERELLQNFTRLLTPFNSLKPGYREVITDIAHRMGVGMSQFVNRTPDSVQDWDLYCHYVAGLVGIGLTKLFVVSDLEDKASFGSIDTEANSMGLFLQKTNIIRDYLEDINDKRIFWPKEVWSKYTSQLENFRDYRHQYYAESLHCLNHLITNALHHIPDSLEYMSKLHDINNFYFCAIPQVMAIATLSACYNNHEVFEGVVKISRELTEKIIGDVNGMKAVYKWYLKFIEELKGNIVPTDPNRNDTLQICNKVIALIQGKQGDPAKL